MPEPAAIENQNPAAPSWVVRWSLPLLIAGTLLIGLSPILIRLSQVGPIATAADRMILSLPVYAALWSSKPDARRLASSADFWLLALAGVLFAADLGFWHWSLKLSTVANATLLSNLAPIFVVLAAWLFWHERLSRLFAVGLTIALVGVVLLMGQSFRLSSATILGDGLALAAAVFYGGYLMVLARLRRRASTIAVMTISGLGASLVLIPAAMLSEGSLFPTTLHGWTTVILLAVAVQLLGQSLIAAAFAHVPTGLAALMLYLQPILAAVLAWIMFEEKMGPLQIIAAAAILAGLHVARRGTSMTA